MDVLVLGGTQFLGREIVLTLLAAGHRLTIFNRGVSPDDLPAAVERLRGDREAGEAGLAALVGRTWDAAIDLSGYQPAAVRASAALLRAQGVSRYLYVSAVMAYGDTHQCPVEETHPLVAPLFAPVTEIDNNAYGRLKAACEQVVREIYGADGICLRPQSVAGPGDPSGRYTYWVRRAELGGEMLAPGDGTDHLQVVDVRDLARFVQTVLENDLRGAFNVAGPRLTWAGFLAMLGAQQLVWVPATVLEAAGLTFVELPVFRPEDGPFAGLMDVSNARAVAAGLTVTPPAVTAADTRAWLRGRDLPLRLSPEREAAVITLARLDG